MSQICDMCLNEMYACTRTRRIQKRSWHRTEGPDKLHVFPINHTDFTCDMHLCSKHLDEVVRMVCGEEWGIKEFKELTKKA